MRDPETTEQKTEQLRQDSREPQETPSEENPYYARTYRKASEPRQESGGFSGKEAAQPEKEKTEREKNRYSSYQFASPASPEKKEKKKNGNNTVRKLGLAAACAAVFGLVAGVVFQGVNYVGGQLVP